jgi:hypothetical protein
MQNFFNQYDEIKNRTDVEIHSFKKLLELEEQRLKINSAVECNVPIKKRGRTDEEASEQTKKKFKSSYSPSHHFQYYLLFVSFFFVLLIFVLLFTLKKLK